MKQQNNNVRNAWDMLCPKCNTDENLDVQVHAFARLTANGTDIDAASDGSHEWDSNSRITCASCGWAGSVKDAEAALKSVVPLWALPPSSYFRDSQHDQD